ncbi:hypothetical protein LSAT2_029028 [Lamellibrachia satsuma]|nr:hypothetical protein LSAT2_029028 [Lamellibrachia satsuma]
MIIKEFRVVMPMSHCSSTATAAARPPQQNSHCSSTAIAAARPPQQHSHCSSTACATNNSRCENYTQWPGDMNGQNNPIFDERKGSLP